jgi:uncharacterized membrane protein (UPF0127 family)
VARHLLQDGLLLIFDPEERGDKFLRNVRSHRITMIYIPEDGNIAVRTLDIL